MKNLDLIVPAYNEEKCVSLLYDNLNKIFEEQKDINWTVYFINDGSRDNTLDEIRNLVSRAEKKNVKYLSFSRNFGKEAAIIAGLEASSAEYIALMDADLQHPPEMLLQMMENLEAGYDVCGAQRVSREGEPVIRSWFSKLFYTLMNKISGLDMVSGGSDFRMMKREVADAIISLREQGRFTKGIFSWVGFETKWIPYHNVERAAGTTSWSFRGLAKYAINGFFAFATTPLRIAIWFGFIVDIITIVAGIRYLYRSLAYGAIGNGVGTLTILVAFFSGTIILILGMIGEYLARIYLEVKARPLYIVKESNVNGEQ